jgi:hypothetical protein
VGENGKRYFINCNWGYAADNGSGVLMEGLNLFRLGTSAAGGKMMPSGNLFFTKGTLIGWMSELNPELFGLLWLMTSRMGGDQFDWRPW